MTPTHLARLPRIITTLLFLLLFTSVSAFGQAVTGSLLGTVTDSSGAAVANAKVVATAVNTNIARTTETNPSGNYAFPTLPPGVYTVTCELEGFRKAVRSNIDVLVNTAMRADLVLTPGNVTESITVTAEATVLQTDRSDTGRKIESTQIANMPLTFNRNFQGLLNLVPGTTRAFRPHSEFFNTQDSLSTQVNGNSRLANNVQFEGVDNNQRTGLLTVVIPPIEALETVDVSTGNYEAELGRAGGAVTNIILRSGTNSIHGAAYEFHKDSAIGARETFLKTKPVTTYNYYGGNVGGPIIKDSTFFFGDFLQIKDRRGDGYIATVPIEPFRSGDFSSQIGKAVIYDPLTGNKDTGAGRTPFEGNKIPDARISPIAKKILAQGVPLPNLGTGLTDNYTGATTRVKDTTSFDVKLDRQQNKNRFSGRYSFQKNTVIDPPRYSVLGGTGKGFAATGTNRTQSAAINYTRLFSPTLIAEGRVGLARYSNKAENSDIGENIAEQIGIPGANLDRWSSGMTTMDLSGYSNPVVGYVNSLPWNRAETNFNFVNNWTKVLRNHTIKFGADARRIRDDLLQTQDAGGPRGQYNFRIQQTSIPGGKTVDQANALASFLLDAPLSFTRDLAVMFPAYRATMLFTYVQDKWQVSPKLTLDIGLRHEFMPPATPRLKAGFANFNPDLNQLELAGVGSVPMNLGRKTYYRNFAPRFGLAYRLSSKTVLRGGFGISWIPYPDNKYAWDNFPVKQNNRYTNQTSYGLARVGSGYGSMATGFPAPTTAIIPDSGIISPAPLDQGMVTVPLDYHEGYVESWNMAVQRTLPGGFTMDAAYVGNHTVRGSVGYNMNAAKIFNVGVAGQPLYAAYKKTASVTLRQAGYSNNYHSLQVKLDRRFSNGFLLTTAYTWGKALGYASESGGLSYYIDERRNYSRLDFDRTQTFVQSYLYELPFGKGKRWFQNGVGRWVLGDWQVNGILTLMTGPPLNISTNTSMNTPGNSSSPDVTGPIKVTHGIAGPSGTDLWFDTSVFKAPLDADGKTPHWGNVGRGVLSGPGLFDLDLSVFRKFTITERFKGEFRAETFNFTNSPIYANPNVTQGSSTFGRVTGTRAINDGSAAGGARVVQLGLKITF